MEAKLLEWSLPENEGSSDGGKGFGCVAGSPEASVEPFSESSRTNSSLGLRYSSSRYLTSCVTSSVFIGLVAAANIAALREDPE